jgi:hypothetical protein
VDQVKKEQEQNQIKLYQLAQELGLIGCTQDGSEDLATNARQYIRKKLYAWGDG